MRSLVATCLVGLGSGGCGPRASASAARGAPVGRATGAASAARLPAQRPFGRNIEVWSWFDLPDEARSRELSGITWDETSRTLWAVQDERSTILSLLPDAALRTWRFGATIPLKLAFPVDLEGIVALPDGFIVCSELGPRLLELNRRGELRRDIPLPEHFKQARANKSLESLSMSPSGKYLFTTSETALTCDGPPASLAAGSRLRILRMGVNDKEITEHAYVTEVAPYGLGDYGVADVAAIGDDDLLILERGWSPGYGNTARLYRVRLDDERSTCTDLPSLDDATPVVTKILVADVANLTADGLPPLKQKQASPLLDNFEGLALGPRLPDGRCTLIIVSDDNARADQFARIVVLAVG